MTYTRLAFFGIGLTCSWYFSARAAQEAPSVEERLALLEQKMNMQASEELSTAAEKFLDDPAAIMEAALSNMDSGNWESAYRWAMLLHILHPESEMDLEAFRIARAGFSRHYNAERLRRDSTRWRNHERQLMYAWIRDRIQRDNFKREEFPLFFKGMPAVFFYEFFNSRRNEQQIGEWNVTIELDNGKVSLIQADKKTSEKP